jgi:hypothetical protein
MNQELRDLFVADQSERRGDIGPASAEYGSMRERDAERRRRVQELLAEGGVSTPDDYFHAALIFQHGETVPEIWQAHELARTAAELGASASMGRKDSRWLAAAALDRWLMYQSKPQKYGTQFVPDGKRWRLWDVDPATSDAERSANHVPALQEQFNQAERYTQDGGFGVDFDTAPEWLKEALRRWEREES